MTGTEFKLGFWGLVSNAKDIIFVASISSSVFITLLTFVSLGLWSVFGEAVIVRAQKELGVEEVRKLALRALGEDRVISQPSGLSYVEEPVRVGGTLSAVVVLRRTAWGENCIFKGGRALFVDRYGVTRTSRQIEANQQIGTDIARILVEMDIPEGQPLGRATVYLSLDYDCRGVAVFDRTYDMPFKLLPSLPSTLREYKDGK